MNAPNPELVRLTQILRRPVTDLSGAEIGRIDDLVAQLRAGKYPTISGVFARIEGQERFIPRSRIHAFTPHALQLEGPLTDVRAFERREGEVLLGRDILAHKLIDLETGRLLRPTDIFLETGEGAWHVIAVDASSRGLLRRLTKRNVDRPIADSAIVDWLRAEPFVGHVPTAKLRLPLPRLKSLHPAQLADLVEAASHEEGEEIITAVHGDPALEADVFEELDTTHQIEFLRSRSDAEVAGILGGMAPDDAADLIGDLEQGRRASILTRLPSKQQSRIRNLLSYNPSTAGGLMTPDFLAIAENCSVADALAQVRDVSINVPLVYVIDIDGHFMGSASLQDLLHAPPGEPTGKSVTTSPVKVHLGSDFTEVALLMADYNLVAAPVVDDNHRLVGVISVDDVLEALIPDAWRRRTEGHAG